MAANDYVTLVKNPRRRRRGRRRNPGLGLGAVTRPLPDAGTIISGMAGAATAMTLPMVLRATSWMNVIWSLAGTIGGGFVMKQVGQSAGNAKDFVMGGSIITALKASHILSNGGFGISPTTSAGSLLPAGAAGNNNNTGAVRGLARPTSARSGVAAFRESEFQSSPAPTEETVLL